MSEAQDTPQDIVRQLSKAFATKDPKVVGGALGIVVRNKGVSTVARQAPSLPNAQRRVQPRPWNGLETARSSRF
jgi:hypothetical protein